MLSQITSVAVVGLEAIPVTVEIDIASQGLPHFVIVGLPNKSVDEARERVRSAIRNSGLDFPNKKITVNLAPADVPKSGSGYDLPIALGILAAAGQIPNNFESKLIYGELSLDGSVRPCNGTVLFSILAKEKNYSELYVPVSNAREASLIEGAKIFACPTLIDVVNHLRELQPLTRESFTTDSFLSAAVVNKNDMNEVQGQYQIKRAMEISAAGSHNLIMIGSPGSGKTMLARTFSTILPDITLDEGIELTKLYSIAGYLTQDSPIINFRPFRSPHHTASVSSIVGGGSQPKPGEISLAHRGVLFLDELLEFPPVVLEALRQPLEDGQIAVSRTALSVTYPAKFILLAACNPCPCGYADSGSGKTCTCSMMQIQRYRKRLSGPVLDRIDLQVKVRAVPVDELGAAKKSESSSIIRERVQKAKNIQIERFKGLPLTSNSEMRAVEVREFCHLDRATQDLLQKAVRNLHLSARSYHRIIKVARTIADLADSEPVEQKHVAEALQYRFSDVG